MLGHAANAGKWLAGNQTARTVAAGGAVVGGLYLGGKLMSKGTQVMGEVPPGPNTFGGGAYGGQMANAVNQYGQAQMGTPL